jgi:hypothetical protein
MLLCRTVVLNVLLSYLRLAAVFLKVLGNSGVVSLVFFKDVTGDL